MMESSEKVVKCCIKNCQSVYSKVLKEHCSIKYYKFPQKRESVCQSWLLNCGNHLAESYKKSSRICSLHFTTNQYTSSLRTRLWPCGIPTIFPKISGVENEIEHLDPIIETSATDNETEVLVPSIETFVTDNELEHLDPTIETFATDYEMEHLDPTIETSATDYEMEHLVPTIETSAELESSSLIGNVCKRKIFLAVLAC